MIAFLHHSGLVLIGGVFVWAGVTHFWKFEAVANGLAKQGFPAPRFLLAAGSLLEIVAGLCLVFGLGVPYAAAALTVFTVVASVIMLNFWRYSGEERNALRNAFTINIAVVGGLLVAAT